MICLRLKLLVLTLAMVAGSVRPMAGESAGSFYRTGERAEKRSDLDTAFQAFKQAHDAKPSDPKYTAAYLRLRFDAAAKHVRSGEVLGDQGKLPEALDEFRQAARIDPSNFEALGQLRRTAELMQRQTRDKDLVNESRARASSFETEARNAAGPVTLETLPNTAVSIHLTSTTDLIYKTIGRLAGLNVLIDPDYRPQKINFELTDVNLHEALAMLALQSKTFWRPLSANTIIVSADSGNRRKDLEQNVMKTFYLRNAATPADLQQAAGTLKAILDINHIQVTPDQRSLTLRGTPDQMVLAQKLLGDVDKPKSEVVIEVMVMEVSRNRLSTIGTNPPTSATVTLAPGGTSSGAGSSLTLDSFTNLRASDFAVSIPGVSFSALASDSNTKVIQRPEIRAMDSEKASLKIGDRIPIATGSYQSGITSGVNTQFQYIDVGVNIDITPYVLSSNEVTLKMALEVSSVTGEQTVDGVTEPTIGQRRIEHQARLADGEVNLIGGILDDTDTKSISGFPWLTKIPILKLLFGQEAKQRQQSEIVFAIIPHIIRSTEVTDENLRMIDLGSANSVSYRKEEKTLDAPAAPVQTAATPRDKPAGSLPVASGDHKASVTASPLPTAAENAH